MTNDDNTTVMNDVVFIIYIYFILCMTYNCIKTCFNYNNRQTTLLIEENQVNEVNEINEVNEVNDNVIIIHSDLDTNNSVVDIHVDDDLPSYSELFKRTY